MNNLILQMYRHSFESFVKFAFNILEPDKDFRDNWHITQLCDYITGLEKDEFNRLIVNQPPRTLKSVVISIAFVAWALGRNPKLKFLVVSGSQDLANDLENKFNMLTSHPRYKALFPDISFINGKTNFGGYRKSLVINSSMMGIGADYIIIDDPLSPQKAQEEIERNNINQIYDQNIYQRLNDKENGKIIIAMQRLHKDDLSGYLLGKSKEWKHLSIPIFCCEDREIKLSYGRTVSLTKYEPLQSENQSFEELCEILEDIGVANFCAQYLQFEKKPSPSVLVYPYQYDSFETWKIAEPEKYFDFRLFQSHGCLVVPEQSPPEHFKAQCEIMREKLKNLKPL